jgi:pimeloyl-ACP methyl ester carboxylesterase
MQVEDEHIILFVPGFKGTSLVDPGKGEKVWLRLAELLFGDSTLAWNKGELSIPGARELSAQEVLSELSILPIVYSYDIYGSCLSSLRKNLPDDFQILTFPYDWRQDNVETARMLVATLQEIRARRPKSITLIAHSMGGLMTSYMLRYGGQSPLTAEESWEGARLVDKVVLAGVPFEGTMLMLRDMQGGVRQGLNADLLSAAALSSFPSSYQLLPYAEERLYDLESSSSDGVDIFDHKTWELYHWGLLQQQLEYNPKDKREDVYAARRKHVARYLGQARAFFERVHAPVSRIATRKIPLLNIVGEGTPTLSRGVRDEKGILSFAIDEKAPNAEGALDLLEDGDGVVSRRAAEVPSAFDVAFTISRVATDAGHGKLCVEENAHRGIVKFILR